MPTTALVQSVSTQIHKVRGESVVLDDAIVALFGVETRRLNEQVRRNASRFDGYAFQLTADEVTNLMSQNATSSWGGRRKTPWVFTEHGVVMAATVLAEADEIELRLLARKLRLVIEAERAMTGGDLDRFVGVLERLGAS